MIATPMSAVILALQETGPGSTPINILITANIVVLSGTMVFVGRVWQRFLEIERKVKRLGKLQRLVERIADKLGVPAELPDFTEGAGD